jgi:hypothetical protein
MGTGHLNAKRAFWQFGNGEFDSDGNAVPIVGWDYGQTSGEDDNNKYVLAQPLIAGSFISVTLAWDRRVAFDNDVDMDGAYDTVDLFQQSNSTFPNPPNDDQIHDLDLYLLPQGSFGLGDAIASSIAIEGTTEHIFFQIPTTGMYEIWVNQADADAVTGPAAQDYAVAWWAVTLPGDYNGDQDVDRDDYTKWKMDYGSTTNLAADGNGDGTVNAANYTVWRNNFGAMLGSGSLVGTAVPEPSASVLCLIGFAYFGCVRRRLA